MPRFKAREALFHHPNGNTGGAQAAWHAASPSAPLAHSRDAHHSRIPAVTASQRDPDKRAEGSAVVRLTLALAVVPERREAGERRRTPQHEPPLAATFLTTPNVRVWTLGSCLPPAVIDTPCTSPVLPGRRSERHSARMTENETKWSERVREWRASGQKAKAFAEGREFKASTLVYWASCLRQGRIGDARPRKRQSRVRMARVVPKSRRPDDAIVVTVGAARVTVRPGFDGALLRQVVRALGEEQ
jgi:hypothetical protein